MINVNNFKPGITFKYEGNIYTVVESQHVKPGKGSAFVKTKLKDLRANSTREITFNAGIKVEPAHITKKPMQFLYSTGSTYAFMDMETYEQSELDKSQLGKQANFLKEGLEISMTYYESEILGIELPEKVDYKIIETEPAVKGNTATNATKDATIETGYVVRVPLFIDENDEIVVSTSTGKYVSKK